MGETSKEKERGRMRGMSLDRPTYPKLEVDGDGLACAVLPHDGGGREVA